MRGLLVLLILVLSINVLSQESYYISGDALRITFDKHSSINKQIIEELLKDTTVSNCKSMTVNGAFNKFPDNFFLLNWIENIEVSSDYKVEFPAEFSSFKKLKTLIVFSEIKKISSNIVFQNLESVQFLNANFKNFPTSICNWTTLEDLDIQNCSFNSIPSCIKLLQNLKRLNLSSNLINNLPDEIYTLKKLKSLGLANNQLNRLSEKICDMDILEEIYLDNNLNLILTSEIKNCLKEKIISLK